jgi:thiol-disulfide isomerase/thioredoxin
MKGLSLINIVIFILVLCQSCDHTSKDSGHVFSDCLQVQNDVRLIIHLRGTGKCRVALAPMTGSRAFTPVWVIEDTGESVADTISVSHNYLPGEFILSFSCNADSLSPLLQYDKYLLVSGQDIELWINPYSGENPDSTWFNPEENENNAFLRFQKANIIRQEGLAKAYESLSEAETSAADVRRKAERKYEKECRTYNRWIDQQSQTKPDLFVSQVIKFYKVPQTRREATGFGKHRPEKYDLGVIKDFSNPDIIRTYGIRRWADKYVELTGNYLPPGEKDDSMLVAAGMAAIERVRFENPCAYGWMADYFYRLFEERDLADGIIMLRPYLEDTTCLTPFRRLIIDRTGRSDEIAPGNVAPDFTFINHMGHYYRFSDYPAAPGMKILFFWNTGCMDCKAVIRQLYTWYQEQTPEERPTVFTVNLDEDYNESEWRKKISGMPEWEHMIDKGEVDSEVANGYCILYTPVVVLIDAQTSKIVSVPSTIGDMRAVMQEYQ